MSNKFFNWLRFMAETGITAIGTAYLGLSLVWSWAYGEEISKTCVILSTLLGIFVGVQRATYNKNNSFSTDDLDEIAADAEDEINGI